MQILCVYSEVPDWANAADSNPKPPIGVASNTRIDQPLRSIQHFKKVKFIIIERIAKGYT